jgi:hypothetical protein
MRWIGCAIIALALFLALGNLFVFRYVPEFGSGFLIGWFCMYLVREVRTLIGWGDDVKGGQG